ncbi:uncharacterized protein LOC110447083 [Mizuhopecten yessoensis]|uniref:uncharacterized protein LOC110447083 n=1 Tax=Mizuhopecten yessoensis TaxID=6573 RepID=UPI000B45BDE8|nr:uncharacterized protein LOC110447083 [Mizuhopecten yessoensis]XP_021348213.1 uncharacterized protein LOC110447083 [Mizuhopecten yessoensis]XP_021348219.1 uncharacterized protein LOC110447083 [Mizuhopecten yessoensis]
MGTPVVITSTVLLLYMFSIPVAPQQANLQQPQAFQVRLPDRQNNEAEPAAAHGKNIEYLNSLLKKRKAKVSNDGIGDKQTLKSRVKRKKKRSKSLDGKLSINKNPSPVNLGKPQDFVQRASIVSQNNQKVVTPGVGGANTGGGANNNVVGGVNNNGVGANNLIENKIKSHLPSAFNNNNNDNDALKRAETNNNVVNSDARVKVIETGGVKQVPRPQDSLPVLSDNIERKSNQDREKPVDVVGGPNMMQDPGQLRADIQANARLNQADAPLRDEKPIQVKNELREVAHDEVHVNSEDEVVEAKDNIVRDNNNQIRVNEQPVHNQENNFQENNRNWQPVINNNPPPMQQHQQQVNKPKKQDSQRIMWDWSDFLINYEQYVMPEQKVRRAPHATTGEPWPMPQYYITSQTKLFRLDREKFHFRISKETCDIIEKAIERYKDYILYDSVQDTYDNLQHAQGSSLEDVYEKYGDEVHTQAGYIDELNIKIRQPCTRLPHDKMDESYDLFIKRTGAFLWANEVWGALRGLETFSQLVFKGTNEELYIRDTVINDYPRFSHRGILLDTARHFLFKDTIFDVLEAMSQNKMNVLHWHIVDDQSFPYQSKVYPDLSDKGAYHPTFVYTHEDLDEIIEYGRMRGIRIMPEFDTPGHTYSWGLSRPDLLTQCYQGTHPVNGYLGPLDPSKNETYRFLKNLFNEVLHVFKDEYIHLGGDEVPMTCWSSNPEVLQLLNKLDGKPDEPINLQNVDPYMYSYDIRKVLEFYEKRLTQDLKEIGRRRKNGVRFVMWQEIMNNNVQLPNDTIIQIWQGDMGDVQRAIDMGYNTIYSTCWYLDLIEYGVKWPKYYNCDPADTSMGYQIDEKKVLGGEACMWAEYVDNENVMTTLWPRASAVAERLWSSKDVKDVDAAGKRLSEHRCRMLSRGLPVGMISGPDYCLRRGHRRDRDNSSNCSVGHCFQSKDTVQIEKINVRVQQRSHNLPVPDCNQIISQGGNMITIAVVIALFIVVIVSIKATGNRMMQGRFCRNKNIFIAFIVVILIYFMCSTSLWMQVLEFKGSFEKRVKSSYSDKGSI